MTMRVPALAIAAALCGAPLLAETAARTEVVPIQAELIADMHVHLIKVGAPVFARVTADWHGADCVLNSGSILEGRAVSVTARTRTVKNSELDLAFSKAQCGQPKMGAFQLMLVAMAAPPEDSDLGIMSDDLPIMTVGAGPSTYGAIMGAKVAQAGAITMQVNTQFDHAPIAPRLKMGEVAGIRGLKLSVGTGPESSSVLTLAGHDVSLERHTVLLLVPAQGTIPREANASSVAHVPVEAGGTPGAGPDATVSSPLAPPPPPADDIDTCEPPQCSVDAANAESAASGTSTASISIRGLGYAPRPQRVQDAFDHDEAMAYLGPGQLLVAFNPHILAPRHTLGPSGPTLRVIRAALIDTATRRILRTVDWELPDLGEYLWPLEKNRVLVHASSELRVYGQDLKILRRIPLDGPLDFVRETPDRSFLAVGVIREKHAPELHAQLRESLGHEPDEDVDIFILNRNFDRIAASRGRSERIPPTLLNEGQAKLLAQPEMRYRIALETWDSHNSTLARFVSSCPPEISSIASDLIFLSSCDTGTSEGEFRILKPDGKLAVKSIPKTDEFGFAAKASANGAAYVVKIVQSGRPILPGALFSALDFTGEELRVYRTSDGKRLLDVRADSPSASRDGFALAPDGSELAVLTRDQIAVYSVPAK
jgi:hypothetical protein